MFSFENFNSNNKIEKKENSKKENSFNLEKIKENLKTVSKIGRIVAFSGLLWFVKEPKAFAQTDSTKIDQNKNNYSLRHQETEEAILEQKKWLLDYINSPKYKERLSKEFARTLKLGFPSSYNDFASNETFQKSFHDKDGKTLGSINVLIPSDQDLERLMSNRDATEFKEILNLFEKQPQELVETLLPVDTTQYDDNLRKTVDGRISQRSQRVKNANYNIEDTLSGGRYGFSSVSDGVKILDFKNQTPDSISFSAPVHEWNHISTQGNEKIESSSGYLIPAIDGYENYSPTEVMARMAELRYLMDKYGIYKAGLSDFAEKDYENFMDFPEIMNDLGIRQLLELLDKDSLIWLMNNIADSSFSISSLENKV